MPGEEILYHQGNPNKASAKPALSGFQTSYISKMENSFSQGSGTSSTAFNFD